jgi:hypothetical protein
MDEKLTKQNHNSFLSKKLSMPGQYHHDLRDQETSHSILPSSIVKQTKINSPSSQTMNIKNPLIGFNYMSLFRPMSLGATQSSIDNHFDSIDGTSSNQQIESNSSAYSTAQSTHFLEEPTVLKLNIPIEMIVRAIPQQLLSSTSPLPLQQLPSSSQEQWNHRCTHPAHSCSPTQMPCQTSSNYTSNPATSLIRKAQEVFFVNDINNDRGDVAPKAIRHVNTPTFDSSVTNDTNKLSSIQQQQQEKTSHKPFQGSPQQSMMSRYSNPSSLSYPKRCQCESTVYSSM